MDLLYLAGSEFATLIKNTSTGNNARGAQFNLNETESSKTLQYRLALLNRIFDWHLTCL
jgi:hypothetical protein